MKTRYVFLLCCVVALSCTDHSVKKADLALPSRELHYNMETGEPVAEKLFTYDVNGNLLSESYNALTPKVRSSQINYTYDAENRMTSQVTRFIDEPVDSYAIVKFRYDGHKKIADEYYSSDSPGETPHSILMYYYGSVEPDSVIAYHHNSAAEFKFNYGTYFRYDDRWRLLEETRKFFDGSIIVTKINTYLGDVLTQSCNPVTGQEGALNCTKFEYHQDETLFRIYATLTGHPDRLLEEYTYQDKLLAEKKVFDQHYYFPAYNSDQTPYTLLVKVEY
jgi:hypothetical protein